MTSSCYMGTGKAQWPGKVLVKVCRAELWAWMWTQNSDFTFTFYMLIFPIMQCFLLEWILDDMAWLGFTLVITFCSMTALVKTTVSCPRGCRCSPTEGQGLSVDCSGLGLTLVPRNLPPNTTILNLSENHIYTLGNVTYTELPRLSLLDLSSNGIVSIDDDAFLGLDTLKTLKLQNNSLHLSDYLFRVLNPIVF